MSNNLPAAEARLSAAKTGGVTAAMYTGLLALSLFLVGWAFAPGHTNADTIDMYQQAKTGVFHDWQSPIISGIWFLMGGQPWVVAFTFSLCLGAFAFFTYHLFRLTDCSHRGACALTLITCYTPPVLGMLGSVCKDTFVGILFLGVLFFSIRSHQKSGWLPGVLRDVAGVMAILVRPEFIIIVGLFLLLEFLFFREVPLVGRARRLMGSALTVLVLYYGLNFTVRSLEHAARHYPEQFLYLSDLTDLSVAENRLLIPAPFLNNNSLAVIQSHYQYPDVTRVFWGGPENEMLRFSQQPKEISDLRQRWIQELENNPGQGLKHRIDILKSYLWAGDFYFSAVDKNNLGLHLYHPTADRFLLGYLALFRHSPLQRHMVSVAGCLLFVLLWFRYGPDTIAARLLVVGLICSFAYQILLSFIGFPPYPRFGFAGLLTFWISFYVVAAILLRSALHPRATPVVDKPSALTPAA